MCTTYQPKLHTHCAILGMLLIFCRPLPPVSGMNVSPVSELWWEGIVMTGAGLYTHIHCPAWHVISRTTIHAVVFVIATCSGALRKLFPGLCLYIYIYKSKKTPRWANKMAQQKKVLAAKIDDLSSNLRIPMVEEKSQLVPALPWPPY